MARYAKSQGKGPKKQKNKDKLKASVHYDRVYNNDRKTAIYKETKLNDGDKSSYYDGHHAGPGPGRPNLIRNKTTKHMSDKKAWENLNKNTEKYKKKKK